MSVLRVWLVWVEQTNLAQTQQLERISSIPTKSMHLLTTYSVYVHHYTGVVSLTNSLLQVIPITVATIVLLS